MCKKKNECDCENNSLGLGILLALLTVLMPAFGGSNQPTTTINIYSDKNIEVKNG